MPTNKNAQIRYQTLDRCLGNWSRRFYIEDLVDACNEALYLYNGTTKEDGGVKKRQVQAVLAFMESEEGYRMLIDRIRDGHKVYFRYHSKNDSIKDQPINQDEMDLIHNALVLLKRFQGVPHFDWLDDLGKCLYSTSKLGENVASVISFQHNPYLKGMDDYYQPVFDAIVNKRVIDIDYHPFGRDVRTVRVSPYHLRQHNNRWFLIAKRMDFDTDYLSNFAIDRIEGIRETSKKYAPLDKDFDFDECFEDVIGVSVTDAPVEEVVIYAKESAFNYIFTKPLHESQVVKRELLPDGRREIDLRVKDNYELRSLLRSFGSQIVVIKPESLRKAMAEDAEALCKMYSR